MNISELINNPQKLEEIFKKVLRKKDKELAHVLVNYVDDPYLVYEYAEKIVEGKVKDELEDVIAENPHLSYRYADLIHEPFPKGEDAIAQDSYWSYMYAKYVLKKPFIKGEKNIINSEIKGSYIKFLEEIGELEEFYKRHPEVKK